LAVQRSSSAAGVKEDIVRKKKGDSPSGKGLRLPKLWQGVQLLNPEYEFNKEGRKENLRVGREKNSSHSLAGKVKKKENRLP